VLAEDLAELLDELRGLQRAVQLGREEVGAVFSGLARDVDEGNVACLFVRLQILRERETGAVAQVFADHDGVGAIALGIGK